AETHDLETRWKAGKGLEIIPTGPEPTLVLPSPFFLSHKQHTWLRVHAETRARAEIEIAWTDARCTTFAAPCSGRHIEASSDSAISLVDLAPDLEGRARSLRFRFRIENDEPLLLRSIRSIAAGEM